MRKNLNRRLEAIERAITQEDPADQTAFLEPELMAVVAYHAGDPQPNDNPQIAFIRALKYPDDIAAAYKVLRSENLAETNRRWDRALRSVFEKCGYDYFPKEKRTEVITKLAEQLPQEWSGWIQRQEYEAGFDFATKRRLINARGAAGWA